MMGNLFSLSGLWESIVPSSQTNGQAMPNTVPSPRKRKTEKMGRRKKKVRFSKKMEEIFFGRKPQYDRFPRDGVIWPLGMSGRHFYRRTCPFPQTDDHKTPRTTTSHPVFFPALQRAKMLTPTMPPRGLSLSQDRRRQELEKIWVSRHQSGCSCLGGCEAESCECLQAGIACSSVSDSLAGWRGCSCFPSLCTNVSHRDSVFRQTVHEHYRRTFSRLWREQRREEERRTKEVVSCVVEMEEEEEEEEEEEDDVCFVDEFVEEEDVSTEDETE